MQRSVLTRLVLVSLALTLSAILTTAWLAALTVSHDEPQESSRSLADENLVYRELLAYAATHTSWDSVDSVLRKLGNITGRNIVIFTQGATITSNDTIDADRRPSRPLATINPLAVEASVDSAAPTTGISPLVSGAYILSDDEKKSLESMADTVAQCVSAHGGEFTTTHRANGRPVVMSVPADLEIECGAPALNSAVTETEYVEVQELDLLTNNCLQKNGYSSITLRRDIDQPIGFSATVDQPETAGPGTQVEPDTDTVQSCLTTSRKHELLGWVAPPAELYIFDPVLPTPAPFSLSARNLLRIAAVSGGVLALAIFATILVGIKLMRPVRQLTDAAERMTAGDAAVRVPVRGTDEIARLSHSFNLMSAERERSETQRVALTSDIAHELRTPLTNIRGGLEARQDGLYTDDEAFTKSLLEDALQLQSIVDDLQDLTQADAGTMKLRKERVDVGDTLAAVVASHSTRARDQQIELEVDGVATPLVIDADAVKLRQIFDNILTNALHHTPEGGTVSITARALRENAVVTIADTGKGIAGEEVDHIFERFWRADPSRSRNTGGSGLGLAIVRKLVTAHEGTVTVESTLGVGTTFTVSLPAARGNATPQ